VEREAVAFIPEPTHGHAAATHPERDRPAASACGRTPWTIRS